MHIRMLMSMLLQSLYSTSVEVDTVHVELRGGLLAASNWRGKIDGRVITG